MQKIKENLIKVSAHVLDRIKELRELEKQREDDRVTFDHYRTKMDKMQKSGGEANSTKPSDQEKYARNISKFD